MKKNFFCSDWLPQGSQGLDGVPGSDGDPGDDVSSAMTLQRPTPSVVPADAVCVHRGHWECLA